MPLIAHNGGDNGRRAFGVATASGWSNAQAYVDEENDAMLVLPTASLAPCTVEDRRAPPDARSLTLARRRPPPPEEVESTPSAHCIFGAASIGKPKEFDAAAGAAPTAAGTAEFAAAAFSD